MIRGREEHQQFFRGAGAGHRGRPARSPPRPTRAASHEPVWQKPRTNRTQRRPRSPQRDRRGPPAEGKKLHESWGEDYGDEEGENYEDDSDYFLSEMTEDWFLRRAFLQHIVSAHHAGRGGN